jgi:branched-chain amino acid transport system ATP-binding protein
MTENQNTSESLLTVSGLHAYYGRAHILSDVDFTLRTGEVVALLGRNGAGKSTTMKSVMGIVQPAKGEVDFVGNAVAGKQPHEICRLGLGYVPEDRRVFSELTVMENLDVGRQPTRAGTAEWTHEKLFEIFPNLAEMRNRPGGRMSGGEQQMLTIARTLMGNPLAVLLDEPSEGLAPVIIEQMANTILDLKKQGLSILLSEQNLHFSTLVSDRAYIIEKGRIRYEGTMKELEEDEEVRSAYLTV